MLKLASKLETKLCTLLAQAFQYQKFQQAMAPGLMEGGWGRGGVSQANSVNTPTCLAQPGEAATHLQAAGQSSDASLQCRLQVSCSQGELAPPQLMAQSGVLPHLTHDLLLRGGVAGGVPLPNLLEAVQAHRCVPDKALHCMESGVEVRAVCVGLGFYFGLTRTMALSALEVLWQLHQACGIIWVGWAAWH